MTPHAELVINRNLFARETHFPVSEHFNLHKDLFNSKAKGSIPVLNQSSLSMKEHWKFQEDVTQS